MHCVQILPSHQNSRNCKSQFAASYGNRGHGHHHRGHDHHHHFRCRQDLHLTEEVDRHGVLVLLLAALLHLLHTPTDGVGASHPEVKCDCDVSSLRVQTQCLFLGASHPEEK